VTNVRESSTKMDCWSQQSIRIDWPVHICLIPCMVS